MGKLTYKSSGVNYDKLDVLKREAQVAAAQTFGMLSKTNFSENKDAQGESAFVIDVKNAQYAFAFVQEGLGTKNLVADAMMKYEEKPYYEAIAQDTVAMIVNDLITVGARPISITAYWAIGSEIWLNNIKRREDLVSGWRNACKMSGAAWTGGETPILSGIIEENAIDLAGAAFGVIEDKKTQLVLGQNLKEGDAIILLESTGIHANGLTLARKLAGKITGGYIADIGNGIRFGDALLVPTHIYSSIIEDIFSKKLPVHYMVNITGHGWRKIMRYKKRDFTYRITSLPKVPQVLKFIQKEAELDNREAYGNFNMGAGFAIFVPQNYAGDIIKIAKKNKINAINAGVVEKGERQVVIDPLKLTFNSESLQVR